MPLKLPRRYWDSYCFLAILNAGSPDETHSQACELILNDARDGAIEIITSALTIVEVIRPKGSPRPIPRDKEAKIRDFFENDYIHIRLVDREIADAARELCWTSGVHPRDAVHLATALTLGCECFETNDPRLLRLNGQVGNPPLLIREPTWTGQLPLAPADQPIEDTEEEA